MTAVLVIAIISVLLVFCYIAGIVLRDLDQRMRDAEWHLDAIEEELEEIHPKLSKNRTRRKETEDVVAEIENVEGEKPISVDRNGRAASRNYRQAVIGVTCQDSSLR